MIEPQSAAELAGSLASAAAQQQIIQLGGNFSKPRAGGPIADAPVVISTRALNRVLSYDPRDLTVSVEAGLPWSELTRTLAEHRQMIPLDPPFAAQATVGGVIATNASGPRRRLYGTARDLIIGMQFATMAGKVVQSGGMVVKNVAGLDTGKLHIGAYGTLGAVTVVNFKVLPMPVETRTFVRECATAAEAIAARDALLEGILQPLALDLLSPAAAAACGLANWCVLVEAGGNTALLDRYARELPDYRAVDGDALWPAVTGFADRFLAAHPAGAVARISTVLRDMGGVLARYGNTHPVIARGANGVSYLFAAEWPIPVDGEKGACEYGPTNRGRDGLWWAPPAELELMKRVKNMLDPNASLNPGRLFGLI